MRLHMALQMMVMPECALTQIAHKRLGTEMNQYMILDVADLVRKIITRITHELILVHIGSCHGGTGSAMFDQTRNSRIGHDNTAVLAKVRVQLERGRGREKSFHFKW